jgi:hypothetical protein
MKPFLHARVSVKKWGGKPEDYLAIHDFLDESKAHFADMRHRALLHNTWGVYLCERLFGHNIKNSDSRLVSVRDIAEQHIVDDMGRIPSVQDYLQGMPKYSWLGGPARKLTRPIDNTVLEEENVD